MVRASKQNAVQIRASKLNIVLATFSCFIGYRWLQTINMIRNIDSKVSTSDKAYADLNKVRSDHTAQDEQSQEQCPIPENHTAMEVSWLKYVKKEGWLPQNTSTIPPEGAFYNDWYPTLDCPSAFETLRWKYGWLAGNMNGNISINRTNNDNTDFGGEITCPPGAPMWTFLEGSISPAESKISSTRILCPDSGTYLLPRGQGVLCQNSIRLRPSRNDAAIARAQGLMYRRQLQVQKQQIPNSAAGSTTDTTTSTSSTSTSQDTSVATASSPSTRPPHILVYVLDAVSRPSLYRNMKATHRTIQDITDRGEDLGTHLYEFKRHHSMGGSSINNLTPMLTGLEFKDMYNHSKTYEAWAHEEFRRLGYISINTHNMCRFFNSTYGESINRHGPEHYFPYEMEDIGWFSSVFCPSHRRYYPRIPMNEVQSNCARTLRDTKAENCMPSKPSDLKQSSCLGGRSRSSLLIEHYLKVREDLEDDAVPTFAFLHDYDLHVRNVVDLHRFDEDKASILKMLQKAGVLQDTVVLFLSDHGNQQTITLTDEGSIEYKLPFWYMMVPNQVLRQRGEDVQAALDHNQHVLTSQPDVHETMLDLAGGRGMGDAAWWKQHGHDPNLLGSSVLQSLPYNRTCDDAGIPAMACLCSKVKFEDLDPNSDLFYRLQRKKLPNIVNHMNEELEKFNLISSGVCRKLELKKLVSASSRPTTDKLTGYNFRFLVKSPRSEPMEFTAAATIGSYEMRNVLQIGTLIQVSRFAHWIEQCEQKVTDAGGNHHFCDCVEPPAVYGWDLNRTAKAA